MSPQQQQLIQNISLHRRRVSLFDKSHQQLQNRQREQIRTECKHFVHSLKKSYTDLPFSSTNFHTQPLQPLQLPSPPALLQQIPSIRHIRQQNHLINETLRKTISRYTYIQKEKTKKLQALNRKKQKYQKIMQIRQQHLTQRKHLNQSLISLYQDISQANFKLKESVDASKGMANQSRVDSRNRNRGLGDLRRQEIFINRTRIYANRTTDVEQNKKLHQEIVGEHRSLKEKKRRMSEIVHKNAVKQYCLKLKSQMQKFTKMDQSQLIKSSKLSPKIAQIQKSKQIINKKLKDYQIFLKDGPTLRKTKMQIKAKAVEDAKKSVRLSTMDPQVDGDHSWRYGHHI